MILFLTLPSAIGLMILSQPLVTFMFEHGELKESTANITRNALLFYSVGLVGHAAIEILSRGFYALSDTRTPVTFAIVSLVANLVLSSVLVWPFEVSGLALAVSLATLIEALLLFVALRSRVEGLDFDGLRSSFVWTAVSTVLMIEVVGAYLLLLHQSGHLHAHSMLDSFLALAGGGIVGVATYFACARALRLEEADVLLRRIPRLSRV
jgi:putative peptidoglycan lipid II flippase